MAKLRVYELARELNLENKALLDKMEEMGIEAKSHMSSLDEDVISQIKNTLFGKKEPEKIVEDKRIKPNVIRRRKKIVEPPPEPAQPMEVSAEAETEETPVESPLSAEPSEAGTETQQTEIIEETPMPAPAETETSDDTIPEATVLAEPQKSGAAEEPAPKAAAEALPEAPDALEPKKADLKTKKREEETALRATPKRKAKKSMPAKIISLPEEPVAPPKAKAALPAQEGQKPGDRFVRQTRKIHATGEIDQTGLAIPPKALEPGAKKKGRKKREDEDFDEETKKIKKVKSASRLKEVVEGAALYDRSFGRSRKGRKKSKTVQVPGGLKTLITIPKAIKRRIKIDDTIVLSDLGKRMGIKANELIAKLMGMGMMVTVNQTIDYDTACLVATEFGFELERATFEEETVIKIKTDDPSQMVQRPPVVTIMGHVDHGKTSLLDVIRRSKITELEAGGITQHIGAYHVKHERGDIVFLDTPGHEAFTAMRSRGAHVTDIVILVVAADDGVMPQTIEAISHARAADVPIIVAVNKIDKPGAEPERIKRELAEKGLVPEDWGGDTIFVNVSAKQKIGIDDLLEMILLQTEVLELKANPNKLASGHIIESRLDTGRGPVATVLVKEGTLRVGDAVICGMYYGKIRIMYDDMGTQIKEAGPSLPVEIVGLSGVPMAGNELNVLAAEKDAKQVSEHRLQKQRAKELARTSRMSLEKLYEKLMEGEVKDLNIIIKADVQGSIEAIKDSLTKLSIDEVKISVIHSAVGPIREADISLAAVSNAIILGFNVRPTAKVALIAEEENVDIRYYDIIYNAIKDIKDAVVGMMETKFEEKVLGEAEVRETFHVPSIGTIAGCYVTSGKMLRGSQLRLIRDGIVTYDGKMGTLRRFKDDVKEVAQNYECGIHIENFNDIKVGDIIECYHMEEVKPVIPA
ncbi:MAG: translation initiation factor IF-2 [Desulfobacterales bacterium CG23_combo_of_CG06-09_8_20_14_all_51_8]|nr:MAG: translation initiation factor IF-2 [Desulfobacterales bacterium CG23_combo_of_CG06-09_8_20_14_all_51_8]